jgi:hypothetical protein
MQKDFKFFSQISTSHSSIESLNPVILREALAKVQSVLPLSGLIVGSLENAAVFDELTCNKRKDDPEIYLWYNLLSDYPGQSEEETIVDYHGKRCKNWFGWSTDAHEEISERFLFSCPNDPLTAQKTLKVLSNLLEKYSFDGVFLDKFRVPSPASGLDQTFSCFCPHCFEKAASQGLDLEEVRMALTRWHADELKGSYDSNAWLEAVIRNKPLLQKFLQFRIDSICDLVKEVRKLTDSLGIKLGLDLFTPSFADFVGESYKALAPYADWVKPMTYQYAMGPAGIRLETMNLIKGLEAIYGVTEDDVFNWTRMNLPWFTREAYTQLMDCCVPMEWINREMREAVHLMPSVPIYMGLECVSFPGVIDIRPEMAVALFKAAIENGADGAVLSWDLMHMPLENLQALKDHYEK